MIASYADWEARMNAAAAAVSLSPVSAWTLVQLDPERPISQKELASRLHCNPSTVVDPTDRLEHAGLVVRHASPTDRRVNVLVVTLKGRKVRDELVGRLFEPPDAFKKLPAKELNRFRDVMLEAVSAALPSSRASAPRAPLVPRARGQGPRAKPPKRDRRVPNRTKR
jgi:DNA-binding MarR family transcriptional regulator